MKQNSSCKPRLRAGGCLAFLIAAVFAGPSVLVSGADTKPADAKPSEAKPSDAKPAKKAEQKSVKKLGGSELYAINCSRCHTERYPTEFNSGRWKTLMTHMRVRANLPAAQAKEILKYLQEESGN